MGERSVLVHGVLVLSGGKEGKPRMAGMTRMEERGRVFIHEWPRMKKRGFGQD
jgi:hypothetical protein